MLLLVAASIGTTSDEYGWCLPSTVDHWSINGAGTNTRCCFGIAPLTDAGFDGPLGVTGGVTVLDTYPAPYSDSATLMENMIDPALRFVEGSIMGLGMTRYHCVMNSTLGYPSGASWAWTESWFQDIIRNANSLPPSCDVESYVQDGVTYTPDRDACLAQCQNMIDHGYSTNEPARFNEVVPFRKCGYAEDGTPDPDKTDEEAYVLSNPTLTALTDTLYGPNPSSPRSS